MQTWYRERLRTAKDSEESEGCNGSLGKGQGDLLR